MDKLVEAFGNKYGKKLFAVPITFIKASQTREKKYPKVDFSKMDKENALLEWTWNTFNGYFWTNEVIASFDVTSILMGPFGIEIGKKSVIVSPYFNPGKKDLHIADTFCIACHHPIRKTFVWFNDKIVEDVDPNCKLGICDSTKVLSNVSKIDADNLAVWYRTMMVESIEAGIIPKSPKGYSDYLVKFSASEENDPKDIYYIYAIITFPAPSSLDDTIKGQLASFTKIMNKYRKTQKKLME